MDYKIKFYILVAFLLGYLVAKATPIYIGYNEDKYNKSSTGILLRKR